MTGPRSERTRVPLEGGARATGPSEREREASDERVSASACLLPYKRRCLVREREREGGSRLAPAAPCCAASDASHAHTAPLPAAADRPLVVVAGAAERARLFS